MWHKTGQIKQFTMESYQTNDRGDSIVSIKKYKIINERIKVVLPVFMASANLFIEKISFIKLINKAFDRAMLESTTRAPNGFLPGLLLEELR
jgi:hypothetical protein